MKEVLAHACRLFAVLALLVSTGLPLSPQDFNTPEQPQPVVDTLLGRILGRRQGKVDAFLGIPFAEAPVGNLRFHPPRPKHAWYPALYRALNQGPECLQSELFASVDDHIVRDEDCLYLNVWRPAVSKQKLPVMVWVYGGAFIHGGANKPEYFGDQLAHKDVILVSFNYRVGALGFLVSTKDGLFGNYGLDDQKTALQWVQDNIEAFGGDPERVTLFGESAGAMSVGLHLLDQHHTPFEDSSNFLNPKRKRKLFHAVIMQSNPLGYK
jgi:para-nitrobenzyl esterase